MSLQAVHVVGGGMTGLTLALRLAERSYPVVVHERVPYLGGLSSEDTLGGIPVERFYHCVLPTDFRLLQLFDELDLHAALGWTRTRTGFFDGQRMIDMSTRTDFLRFPLIGPLDRIRLAWTILWCGMQQNPRRLDREPISSFLLRHGGERLFRAIWEPLLLSKLGTSYDRFAASFIWATVYRMLSARRAKGRAEKLGFVRGRYGRVFAALRAAIEAKGGEVRTGVAVQGLRRDPSGAGWILEREDGSVRAEAVVFCTPTGVTKACLELAGVDPPRELLETEYLGVLCESLLLRRSLSPYYVLNLTDRSLPFTGVIETSNLTGPDEFGGHHLVYLPRYRSQADRDWGREDDELHRENLNGLRRIFPDLSEDDVVAWTVHRARSVQPIHGIGRGERLPPIRLGERLATVCTAQVHPWPVFNDEAVGVVERGLEDVLAVLPQPSVPKST